nr:ParB N-terminal domain-containing protein [uncultured Clostridium sp.]
MYIKNVAVKELQVAVYNPRKELQPEDVEYQRIKKSLDKFGCVEPIIWNEKTGNVVGGHQRLRILMDEGLESVDVSVVNLDTVEEKALNVALNKISGNWDIEKLTDIMQELVEKDYASFTGYSEKEIEKLIDQVNIDATISTLGEIDTADFSADNFKNKCPRCGFLY